MSQIDLKSLWDKMTPRQRIKYADRFKTLDAAHIDSYDFGTPSLKPQPSVPSQPSQPSSPSVPSQPSKPSVPSVKDDDKKDDKKDGDSKDKKDGISDKDIEKDFKSFLSNLPKTYSDRVKTVNLDKLNQATMDKAKMIKAGDLYYKTNDIEQARGYLEQNNLDYKIDESLSTPDHLVLVNNQDATDVRIASRGTDIRNTDDLRADVDILMGRQNKNSTFKVGKELAQKVKAAYPQADIDALGFSLGGAKSIHMSNEVPGVKSTTFNPYVVHEAADTGNHTIFRTKDDLPSFISGSLRDKGNIEINTVNSLDPDSYFQKEHHSLKNFLSNKPETDASGKPKTERLERPMTPEEKAAAISQFEDPPPARPAPTGDTESLESEFVDTSLSEDPMFQDPRGLPDNFQGLDSNVGTQQAKPKQFDQKDFEKYRDEFRDTWGTDDEQITDEGLEQMYRDSLAESSSGDSPPTSGEVDRPVGNPLEDAETRYQQHHFKNLQKHAQADTFIEHIIPSLEDGLSYSEHVHSVNMMSDGTFGSDTLVDPVTGDISLNMETGRMGRHSLFYKLWKQGGGKFTDEEEKYFDKYGAADESIGQDSLLSNDEAAAMLKEGSKEGPTYTKIKQDMLDSNNALNDVTTEPPADYLHVTSEGSEFRPTPQSGGPSLAHGLTSGGAGMLASTLVDYALENTEFGKNLSVPEKTAISSSVGGVAGEAVFSRLATGSALSGAGVGIAGLSGLGVVGGSAAVGALTTYGTEIGVDKGLKALGVENKDVRDITKDEVGNVAGSLATVGSAALAGAALGVPLDGVTLGGASLVAGGLGALIGLGQYAEDKTHFVEKGWKAFKSLF
jgi:hypothetical protein